MDKIFTFPRLPKAYIFCLCHTLRAYTLRPRPYILNQKANYIHKLQDPITLTQHIASTKPRAHCAICIIVFITVKSSVGQKQNSHPTLPILNLLQFQTHLTHDVSLIHTLGPKCQCIAELFLP